VAVSLVEVTLQILQEALVLFRETSCPRAQDGLADLPGPVLPLYEQLKVTQQPLICSQLRSLQQIKLPYKCAMHGQSHPNVSNKTAQTYISSPHQQLKAAHSALHQRCWWPAYLQKIKQHELRNQHMQGTTKEPSYPAASGAEGAAQCELLHPCCWPAPLEKTQNEYTPGRIKMAGS
jgi:hypothetical protein